MFLKNIIKIWLFSFTVFRHPPNNKLRNTQYINIFLQLDYIPQLYNIYAFISIYIFLVGYIVFFSIFTSIHNSSTVEGVAGKSYTKQTVFKAVQNVPLLVIAALYYITGVIKIYLL